MNDNLFWVCNVFIILYDVYSVCNKKNHWFGNYAQVVTLHFQSYMNKIKIVLAVDNLSVPDPHQLLDDLQQSLKETTDVNLRWVGYILEKKGEVYTWTVEKKWQGL